MKWTDEQVANWNSLTNEAKIERLMYGVNYLTLFREEAINTIKGLTAEVAALREQVATLGRQP